MGCMELRSSLGGAFFILSISFACQGRALFFRASDNNLFYLGGGWTRSSYLHSVLGVGTGNSGHYVTWIVTILSPGW